LRALTSKEGKDKEEKRGTKEEARNALSDQIKEKGEFAQVAMTVPQIREGQELLKY
jgi:hypothetical protein